VQRPGPGNRPDQKDRRKLNIGINPEVIEKLIGLGLVLAALVMMANFVGAGAN
jgi:hypothetical protein